MRSIDLHAHLEPQCFQKAIREGKTWHGISAGDDEADLDPMEEWTPEQRIQDMNSLGVEMQVVSTSSGFYQYDREPATTLAIARDCNNEVHQMTLDHPDRFKGFATLPMQDPSLAIEELDRAVNQLGLIGAMVDDQVNARIMMRQSSFPSGRQRNRWVPSFSSIRAHPLWWSPASTVTTCPTPLATRLTGRLLSRPWSLGE